MVTNNYNLYSILLVMIPLCSEYSCEYCSYINNISFTVTMKVEDGSSNTYDIPQYTGCIVPDKIGGNVEEIVILDQEIFTIGNRSISDMRELKKLLFVGCEISEIVAGAFHNVPNLRVFHVRNGNLKVINAGIFNRIPTIEVINFKENDIFSIDKHAFANIPSLKEITLSNNDLNEINSHWFSNSTNIEYLDFTHNNLQRIGKSTFSEISKLNKVLLDFNDIEAIEEGAFKNFKDMKHLGLSHNRLNQLDANAFQHKLFIERISLNVNFLNFLSAGLLTILKVKEIFLEGNPWICPCLDRIHNWLLENNSSLNITDSCSRPDIPQCVNSKDLFSHCVEVVDEDLTEAYINTLKSLIPRVDDFCARFD